MEQKRLCPYCMGELPPAAARMKTELRQRELNNK